MNNIVLLRAVDWRRRERLGGKAANCALLLQAGFPVPDGLVVASTGMDSTAALDELREALEHWPPDSLFAVRSSASDEDSSADSFAGVHETLLNVHCSDVSDAVRTCWKSLNSEQARSYRESRGRVDSGSMGVLVQLMVPASVAGVVFTRNPLNGAREIVINAAPGLADELVSGRVQPDQWRVTFDGNILASQRAEPSADRNLVLTTSEVKQLAALSSRIQDFFGVPQDIEWCHDGQTFWVVQSRPITTRISAVPDREWTRGNLKEVWPELAAPQVTDVLCDLLETAERDYGGRLWGPRETVGPIAKAFNGRPYFNVEQIRYACSMIGQPAAQVFRALGYSGPIRAEDEIAAPRPWKEFLLATPDLLRTISCQFRIGAMIRHYLRNMSRDMEKYWPSDISHVTDAQLAAGFRTGKRIARGLRPIFALSAIMSYEDALRKMLERKNIAFNDLVLPFLAAGEKSVSSQQGFDLLRLAAVARGDERVSRFFREAEDLMRYRDALAGTAFGTAFERFLELYGHRGEFESDWSLPHYHEDPSPLLRAIRAHVQAPSCPDADQVEQAQERAARQAWQRFEQQLRTRDRLLILPLVRWFLRHIKQMYLWREYYRSELVRHLGRRRKWHLGIADRFHKRGWIDSPHDYFMLKFAEIEATLDRYQPPDRLKAIVEQRKKEMEIWRQIEMPLQLHDRDLLHLAGPVLAADHKVRWTGLCVSPGCVEAEVAVVLSANDFDRMKPGRILVAPATSPAWTPLFTLASGMIVEIGGLLSHASTVAREYGLPALANVPNATRIFHDGDRVRLDATAGTVELLSAHAEAATSNKN